MTTLSRRNYVLATKDFPRGILRRVFHRQEYPDVGGDTFLRRPNDEHIVAV